jgi:O-antigen ligase
MSVISFRRYGQFEIHSFVVGLLLGIPFVYPTVPYYWFAFAAFSSVLIYLDKKIPFRVLTLVLMAMVVSVSSSILGLDGYEIQPVRVFFTSSYFLFFFFAYLVPDKKALLKGYLRATEMMSIAVIVAALIVRPFESGLLMFSVPDLRLWGMPYFPDWPNFLAFMLSLAFLLNALVFKKTVMAVLNISAALLTTSRTPLLSITIFFLAYIFSREKSFSHRFCAFWVVILFCAFSVGMIQFLPPEFLARFFITSDREIVYGHALHMIEISPFIGHGAILFDSSVGMERFTSFHNSYLDITVRHGVLGLFFFFALLWPRRIDLNGQKGAYWAIIAFFLIGSMFQNFLKHPHLLMLYTVIVATSGVFQRRADER